MFDTKLALTNNIRDIGVIADNRLTFKSHITSIVSRSHLRAMQIWRCFLCKDIDVLIRAFISYVQVVPYFSFLVSCARLSWPSRQLSKMESLLLQTTDRR